MDPGPVNLAAHKNTQKAKPVSYIYTHVARAGTKCLIHFKHLTSFSIDFSQWSGFSSYVIV